MQRIGRVFVSVAIILATSITVAAPANAGTLTSASLTTNGSGYAVTNASNTRYDWRYTTATSGSTSRVEATVPSGTTTYGSRFLTIPGTVGNYASTPYSAGSALSTTLDLKVNAAVSNWYSGAHILGRWATAKGSFFLSLDQSNSSRLTFYYSPNGSSTTSYNSSIPTGFTAGSTHWVRATFMADNGSGGSTVVFYTSSDGSSWSQLGTPVNFGQIPGVFASTAPINVGLSPVDNLTLMKGKIYFASVAGTINGTTSSASSCSSLGVVACLNPSDFFTGTTLTSSSPQAETWTINRTGTNLPADIATDLSVAEISGLPTGGSSSYRMIDGKAVYVLPTSTSVPAGTPTLLALSGFTNTAIAGSNPSTITTFDSSATPVALDSATTSALAFSDLASSAIVGTTVDPTFTLTLTSHAGACNGYTQTAGTSASSTAVNLGRLTSAAPAVAAQDLTVGTNANAGFTVRMRAVALTSGTNTIASAPGTNASPVAFPATTTAAAGYSVGNLPRFASSWAGLSNTDPFQYMASASAPATVTNCIAYKVQVTAATPAGTYSTTAVYTAVPNF